MEDNIVITVPYREGEREITLRWQPIGYTHRFVADIDGVEVYFEPDEERNYRVVLSPDMADTKVKINVELIGSVVTVLQDNLG